MEPKKRVTQEDIARARKIDQGSVSRILNEDTRDSFAEETVQKVFKVARELGYLHPSLITSNRRESSRRKAEVTGRVQVMIGTNTVYDEGEIDITEATMAGEMGGSLSGAVVLLGPRTFTREDIVEIHLPASPPLVDRLLRELLGRGARPARPGEFTLRAFLNGRLDLAQAEAVEQLISAEDDAERRAALGQLEGDFSRGLATVESSLLDLC